MNDVTTSFEEELDKNGFFIYTSKGTSMLPLIKEGRDVLLIRKTDGCIKKYDIALYKKNDKYVLHRIMRVDENGYSTCGDHQIRWETGIKRANILGVLSGLKRKNEEIDFNSFSYRMYILFWCKLFFIRVIILKGSYYLHRIKNRIIGMGV